MARGNGRRRGHERAGLIALAALLIFFTGAEPATAGENCNPVTGICGKCENCGPAPRPSRPGRGEGEWIPPSPPRPSPGPSPEEIRRAQEEQARRQAAEDALRKARNAMEQGNLSGAIQYLQEALRNQPNNAALQGQLQNVRALKEAKDQRETQERIAALKREAAAMQTEEARLAAERAAAQVRLDAALNTLGPRITPGTAFQQLEQAARQGQDGTREIIDERAVKGVQVPWDQSAPLPLPTPPVTLSAPLRFKRPEDRATYTRYDRDRIRLQGEYKVLEQQLTTTTDPVAQSKVKMQLTNKKSEIDTVVVKMLDLSFQAGNRPPAAQGKE